MEGTLLETLFPRPTGEDGHEEYIRAADIVNASELRERDYNELLPTKLSSDEIRDLANRFSEAAELVRTGNRKPFRPLWREAVGRDFADLQPLRKLNVVLRITAANARQYRQPEAAVAWVLESFTYGDRISRDSLIHSILGYVVQSHAMNDVAGFLGHMSARMLSQVEEYARFQLAQRLLVLDAAQGEYRFSTTWDPTREEEQAPALDEYQEAVRARTKELSPPERERYRELLNERIDRIFVEIRSLLAGDEGQWLRIAQISAPKPPPPFPTMEEVADATVSQAMNSWSTLATGPVQIRARLRILILSIHAEHYQRAHGFYPRAAEDLGASDDLHDPLTGGRFVYQRTAQGYQFFSRGTKETGQIDLRKIRSGPPKS